MNYNQNFSFLFNDTYISKNEQYQFLNLILNDFKTRLSILIIGNIFCIIYILFNKKHNLETNFVIQIILWFFIFYNIIFGLTILKIII